MKKRNFEFYQWLSVIFCFLQNYEQKNIFLPLLVESGKLHHLIFDCLKTGLF